LRAGKTRRNLNALDAQLAQARSREDRAEAHFQLALFHDNNSREAQAIPHYRSALRAGLKGERRARALAWLASSLYKTGNPQEAVKRLKESARLTSDPALTKFIQGLLRRIERSK